MYNAIKDVVANADGQVVIGEVNQDATAQNIQQRGGGFIDKMIELLQADGKTVAVAGNEFYVNAAKGADATEADADVVIQVAVPAQTTVELCSNEAQAILSKENCIAIFGSNQTAAEGVLAANANLDVLVLMQLTATLSVLVSMLVLSSKQQFRMEHSLVQLHSLL